MEAERWGARRTVAASTCGDAGNSGTDVGTSPEAFMVVILNVVTFRLLFVGVLLDMVDDKDGPRVICVV